MRLPLLHHHPRLRRAVAAGSAVVVVTGGAAFAYWTTTGSGSDTAASTQPSAVVVKQTTVLTDVNPGRAAQTLGGKFDNPGPGSAYVTSVTAAIASVSKAAGAPAGTCEAGDYTLAGATMAVGAEVAQGNAQGSWSGATLAFNDKTVNQDACKGATVNLSYTSN